MRALAFPCLARAASGAALLAGLASPVASPAADGVVFSAAREGEFILIKASADLQVDSATAWSVLTDYDHYAEFIPDMHFSRVVSRGDGGMVVEQKGEFGFLLYRQEVEVRMAVIESPPGSMAGGTACAAASNAPPASTGDLDACARGAIVARALSGSFRDLAGRYEVSRSPAGMRLSYDGRLLPDFSLPPFIGLAILRQAMERQFQAMVDEIVRRDSLDRSRKRSPERP